LPLYKKEYGVLIVHKHFRTIVQQQDTQKTNLAKAYASQSYRLQFSLFRRLSKKVAHRRGYGSGKREETLSRPVWRASVNVKPKRLVAHSTVPRNHPRILSLQAFQNNNAQDYRVNREDITTTGQNRTHNH
jgi:hypothetical protein